MKYNIFTLGCASIILTACASIPDPVKASNPEAIKAAPGSLALVKDVNMNFTHLQSSAAAFGVIGTLASASKGKTLVEESGLQDPSLTVESLLKSYLLENTAMKNASDIVPIEEGESGPDVKPDYAIDAKSALWGVIYFPTSWSKYQVHYKSNVALMKVNPEETIARGNCEYKYPETPEDSPTYDELTANNAQLLKEYLNIVAEKCVEDFKRDALGF